MIEGNSIFVLVNNPIRVKMSCSINFWVMIIFIFFLDFVNILVLGSPLLFILTLAFIFYFLTLKLIYLIFHLSLDKTSRFSIRYDYEKWLCYNVLYSERRRILLLSKERKIAMDKNLEQIKEIVLLSYRF